MGCPRTSSYQSKDQYPTPSTSQAKDILKSKIPKRRLDVNVVKLMGSGANLFRGDNVKAHVGLSRLHKQVEPNP